jgi:hypothetical protein
MIFVSKPVTIEAFQWFGDERQNEDPEWIVEGIKNGSVTFERVAGQLRMIIHHAQHHLTNYAEPGDWIIRSEDGFHRPMSLDVFDILYERQTNTNNERKTK